MPNPKFFLLKGGRHGLGNRLLLLTTAIALSKKYGAKLIIDWSEGGQNGPSFFDVFKLVGCEDILSENQDPSSLNGLSTAQTEWLDNYQGNCEEVRRNYTEKHNFPGLDLQEIPKISGLLTVFTGALQKEVVVLCGYTRVGQNPSLLLAHLKLSSSFASRLRHSVPGTVGSKDNSYLALHVRATADAYFPKPNFAKIARVVNSNPGLPIFLATDSKDLEDVMFNEFGNRVIVTEKFFPSVPNQKNRVEPFGLHVVDELECNISKVDLLFEAIRDIYILSRGEVFLFQPQSTFSEIATIFSVCRPWNVVPHCEASARVRVAGFMRACLKYRSGEGRPSFLQQDC